jgi:hypothetical protein
MAAQNLKIREESSRYISRIKHVIEGGKVVSF